MIGNMTSLNIGHRLFNPHLDPVFLTVIKKRNGMILLFLPIHADANGSIAAGHLQNRDVINRLPKAVVQFKPFPVRGNTGRHSQFIRLQAEPEK